MGYNCEKCSIHTVGEAANKISTVLRKVKYDKMGSFVDRATKKRESFCMDSSVGHETVREIVVCRDCVNLFEDDFEPKWEERQKFVKFRYDKKKPEIKKKPNKRRED